MTRPESTTSRSQDLTNIEGWSFSTLGCPGATASEVVELARRFGYSGVEIRSEYGEFLSPTMTNAEVQDIRDTFSNAGIRILAITTRLELCAEVRREADQVLDDLENTIRIARVLGASGIRVFMHDPTPGTEEVSAGEQRAIARIAAVTTACIDARLELLIETHDSHSTGKSIRRFLDAVALEIPEDPVGIVWDTAHSWAANECFPATLAYLKDRIRYVQIKDVFSRSQPTPVVLGQGRFPVGELMGTLLDEQWQGWLSLEWEKAWHPELPSIEAALKQSRSWVSSLTAAEARPVQLAT